MIRQLTASVALLALSPFAGCDESGAKSPTVDLEVGEYAALGTAVPHLVQHRGRLYAFWRGEPQKKTNPLEGLPCIPKEFMRGSRRAGGNTVVYANRLDAGRWSAARLLAAGDVQCDPAYVWSDDRGLNLIVDLGDSTCSHLLLDSGGKWQQIRHFPELKDGIFVPLGIQQRGNELHAVTFDQAKLCYWHYDGHEWHGPLVIESEVKFDGTWGYFRPRLAVSDSGDVHVVWNTQEDPSHVIIRHDKIVSKNSIQLTPRVQKGDEVDIEALAGGGLLLAYQVAEEAVETQKNSIYVSIFKDGKWGQASPAPSGGGLVLGGPQLTTHEDEALLVWQHRTEARNGGLVASGPTASYSVRNAAGEWTQPTSLKPVSTDLSAVLGGEPTFYSLYCAADGQTYIIWGDDSIYVMKLHAFGGKPTGGASSSSQP